MKEYNYDFTRPEYCLNTMSKYLEGNILDVGSGGSPAYFRPALGTRYKALDIADSRCRPDVYLNFEQESLPFENNAFDTVLSFDCIEHCDNIHFVFDEILRVAKKRVIISLPNNWPGFITSILKGSNVTHRMGYGLTSQPYAPGVRHKWWFNLEEAEKFIVERAKLHGYRAIDVRHVYERGDNLIKFGVYPEIMFITSGKVARFSKMTPEEIKRFGFMGRVLNKSLSVFGPTGTKFLATTAKIFLGYPFKIIDEVLKRLIWGWGSKYRYANLFCRQVWVVLEKQSDA
jgi:SAM-dependent methyltransferase